MRNTDYQEKDSLTETRKGVGFAELWRKLERTVFKAVRSRHSRPHRKIREHQQREIALHGEDDLKKPGRLVRQCEGDGKWKSHRGSDALSQGC